MPIDDKEKCVTGAEGREPGRGIRVTGSGNGAREPGRGTDEGFLRREVCVLAIRVLRIPHGIVLEYLEEFGRKVVETITVTGDQRGK